MPRTLFPQGIPTSALTDRARSLAEELDKSSLIARSSPSTKGDGKVDAEEIKSALGQVDQFDSDTRDAVKQLASALGVEATNAPPLKREWQDRTTERFDTPVAATTMGDRAVVLDGSSSEEYPVLRTYDPATDQWSKIDLPQNFWGQTKGSSIAGDKNSLYFSAGDWTNGRPVPWTLRYDNNSKQWQTLANNPNPQDHAAAATLGGNLVLAGGASGQYSGKVSASVVMYDATKGQWSSLPDLPVARTYASALEVGGKLVVVGGRDANGTTLDRVDVYDPKTGQWQNPPLRVATPTTRASLWAEGSVLHVTGGENGSGRTNNNHDTLDLASGKLDNAASLPPNGTNLFAARVGDRVFAFGEELTNSRKAFTREWAVAKNQPGAAGDSGAGGAAPTVVNNTVNNNVFNLQVVNVDLTQVTNNVTNFVDVSTAVTQNVTVNDTRLSLTPISINGLGAESDGNFYDPDDDFFLRTQASHKPLMRFGSDAGGQRYLVGLSDGGKSAVPRERNELFAYHAGSRTLIPFKSDAQGQFAIPLPSGLSGPLQIFAMKGGVPSGAGTVTVP